jgi:hypothetical protein
METFLCFIAIWAVFDYAVVKPIRKEEITEHENK